VWTYTQLGGRLYQDDELVGIGYSGWKSGKNNPSMQDVAFVGPIPCGVYTIGEPYDSREHGPYVLSLTPDETNEMFRRHDFRIHGDSKSEPGMASEGCIILSRDVRRRIWESGDHELIVVSGMEPVPGLTT
jgi:hypothetical protein